jgi:ribosome-associated heat shock protein Hsp15
MDKDKVRVDQYLWAIRMFKTRTLASKAIGDGKVKLNGEDVKASRAVHIGDVYQIKTSEKRISVKVSRIISKRVAYSEAINHYYDVSTEEEKSYALNKVSSSFYTGKRLSNTGKPSKKQIRDLNEFLDTGEE